jgi:hypothetical protein
MKTFILFIYGFFDDHEDIEFFCSDVLSDISIIKKVRYVIENSTNVIVIFDSDSDYKEISTELFTVLGINENIKLYFIFERDSMVTAHLPAQVKDFIFKPAEEDSIIRIEYTKNPKGSPSMDLDELLEKIEKMGVDSLTPEEKNFLDNFDK